MDRCCTQGRSRNDRLERYRVLRFLSSIIILYRERKNSTYSDKKTGITVLQCPKNDQKYVVGRSITKSSSCCVLDGLKGRVKTLG